MVVVVRGHVQRDEICGFVFTKSLPIFLDIDYPLTCCVLDAFSPFSLTV